MSVKNPELKSADRRQFLQKSGAAIASVALLGGIYGCQGENGNGASADDAKLSAIKSAVEPTLIGQMAAMAVRNPSEDLSALAFNNDAGEAVTMADTGKKLRLVNLWATWCAPCREEMPWLDELQAKFGGDDFDVVAISVDAGDPAKPKGFFNEIGLSNLAFYHDPSLQLFNGLKKQSLAFGLPVTILIDADNRVVANMNGPAHWSSDDAFTLVETAIKAANESA